jgi:hypothetical protein
MAGMPALRAKANISCPACFAGFYRAIASFAARADGVAGKQAL